MLPPGIPRMLHTPPPPPLHTPLTPGVPPLHNEHLAAMLHSPPPPPPPPLAPSAPPLHHEQPPLHPSLPLPPDSLPPHPSLTHPPLAHTHSPLTHSQPLQSPDFGPFAPPPPPPLVPPPPMPPLHPLLAALGPAALEWQQVYDSGQAADAYIHVPSGFTQRLPPGGGFTPTHLQLEADMARYAAALHAHLHAQHAQHAALAASSVAVPAAVHLPHEHASVAQPPHGLMSVALPPHEHASVAAAGVPAPQNNAASTHVPASPAAPAAPQPPQPAHKFVRGAIDVSALERGATHTPPPPLHAQQAHDTAPHLHQHRYQHHEPFASTHTLTPAWTTHAQPHMNAAPPHELHPHMSAAAPPILPPPHTSLGPTPPELPLPQPPLPTAPVHDKGIAKEGIAPSLHASRLATSPPPSSLPPPPPTLHPPPFPDVLHPPTPSGLLAHAQARARARAAAASSTPATSSGSTRRAPPPGFAPQPPPPLQPPLHTPPLHTPSPTPAGMPAGAPAGMTTARPETTGMMAHLPMGAGTHTYFPSSDASQDSSAVTGSAAVSGAGNGRGGSCAGGVDGVDGGGGRLQGLEEGGGDVEATSTLRAAAEVAQDGRDLGAQDGLSLGAGGSRRGSEVRRGGSAGVAAQQKSVGGGGDEGGECEGGSDGESRDGVGGSVGGREGVGGRRKGKKQSVWQELQGDEASEAREAVLKKAMAATMALLPEEQKQGERVVMDPSLAAYVRSILPRNVAKYWLQRYSLFTKYDDGIQLDTEGWWSVTPEILASHQSSLCKRYSRGHVALDAMAGCAGNAIQLTNDFTLVYAVEISKRRADMARHNAEVYGVGSQVEVLCTDFFKAAPLLFAEAIFVSPPWGGPKYKWCDTFEVLETVEGMAFSIKHLILTALDVVGRSTSERPVMEQQQRQQRLRAQQHHHQLQQQQQQQGGPSTLQAAGSKLCEGVRTLLAAAAPPGAHPPHAMNPPPPPIPRFVSGTFDLATLEARKAAAASASGNSAAAAGDSAHLQQRGAGHVHGVPNGVVSTQPAVASSSGASSTRGAAATARRPSKTQGVVAVFLPRNTDLKQLASLVPQGSVWHVERNFVNGRLKGLSFYCFST